MLVGCSSEMWTLCMTREILSWIYLYKRYGYRLTFSLISCSFVNNMHHWSVVQVKTSEQAGSRESDTLVPEF